MLFSQRYHRPLGLGTFKVEIPVEARRKLWAWMNDRSASFYVQRDANDNWSDTTSTVEEALRRLMVEHGVDDLRGLHENDTDYYRAGRELVHSASGEMVFDFIELYGEEVEVDLREALRLKVNQVFALHDCSWRMADGEFFKLDPEFIGAQAALEAHETLVGAGMEGATREFAKAQMYLAHGETREAINNAAHSYESVLKVAAGERRGTADKLIQKLIDTGYFDALPKEDRAAFKTNVLFALPFIRNRFAGHGHGKEVLDLPKGYGALAVQLAAALNNFIIGLHLERNPPPPLTMPLPSDDDIPF